MEEVAVGVDLRAEGGGLVLVTQCGEADVLVRGLGVCRRSMALGVGALRGAGVGLGREAGEGSGLQEPGAAVVVLLVAGEQGGAVGAEPDEVVGEPLIDGGEIFGGEGLGAGEEADGLGDFGELHGLEDAFGAGSGGAGQSCA